MPHGDILKKTKEEAQLICQNGLALLHKGKLEEADALFLQAHQLDPSNTETLNLLGIRSYQKQDYKTALALLEKADQLSPHSAQTLSNLGLVHNALLQFNEALHFFNLAINGDPLVPEIYNNRGNALKGLDRNHEAIEAYEKAISLRTDYAEAISNQGVIFLEEGETEKAVAFFEQAIQINPNLAVAFNSLGNALSQLDRYEDAFQSFERALQINPIYLDACLNFGSSLKKCKHFSAAIDCYQYALKLSPNNGRAFYLLGDAYYETGDSALAKTYLAKSLELNPADMEAQFGLTIAQIPKVYKSQEEISESRESFAKQLQFLQANIDAASSLDQIENTLGRHPFYLAYQDENNKRLLSQYGLICVQEAKVFQGQLNKVERTPPPHHHAKIRIGIVSNYFCNHPVWHAITKAWIEHLDQSKFEIRLFNTNGLMDQETEFAKSKAENYTNCGGSVSKAAQVIINQHLDVLLYPEIGMDPTSKGLACLRLAPLQVASWGHPETTGLPTIDFFLSATLFESPESNKHYTEKLIQLPNLGTYFSQESIQSITPSFESLGIDGSSPILLCAGSPSKYTPTHDQVFINVTKRLGTCQFVFFNFEDKLTAILKERLYQSFSNSQLNADDFIRFIRFLKKEEFYGLMKVADLYLDTIGFSGFNTAMQAIICDLPIVTVEGNWMRSRLASGILRHLGLDQFICKTHDAYIDLVVELIQNQDLLQLYKAQMMKSKLILFNDLEPIRALETYLIQQTAKHE